MILSAEGLYISSFCIFGQKEVHVHTNDVVTHIIEEGRNADDGRNLPSDLLYFVVPALQ